MSVSLGLTFCTGHLQNSVPTNIKCVPKSSVLQKNIFLEYTTRSINNPHSIINRVYLNCLFLLRGAVEFATAFISPGLQCSLEPLSRLTTQRQRVKYFYEVLYDASGCRGKLISIGKIKYHFSTLARKRKQSPTKR